MTDLLAPPLVDVVPRGHGIRASVAISTDAAALPVLTAVAGVLYLVNLTVSGYANTYYAMAAQAASQSWSALFFGALDSQGFITIDKPPLATWLMGLSVKVLGLSSWSILLPEALLGIGSVLVLYLAVRRSFGSNAAMIAGTLMAVMPVAVLIFRYDNPDALLTFLLVTAAWALGRGLEHGRLRWALLAASLVGAAFLTKYLQAYLVLPGFALVWLVSAPVSLRRRLIGLVAAAVTVAVTSFWWVAIVELIPAGSRPYIGGSTTNSPLELLLGYDGLGRIFGNQPGGSGLGSALDGLAFGAAPGGGGPTFSGTPGLFRLFNDQFAGQIAWLIPAALLALGVGIVLHLRSGRTDRRFAGYVLWGTWLAVHVAVFSFMSGIIHTYYAVILVPAIAALVGGATIELWRRRASDARAGVVLAVGIAITGLMGFAILEHTPGFAPGLAYGVLAGGRRRRRDPGRPPERPRPAGRARRRRGRDPRRPARLRGRHDGHGLLRRRSERGSPVRGVDRRAGRQRACRARRGDGDRPGARRLSRREPGVCSLDRRGIGLPGRRRHPARRRPARPHDGRLHGQRPGPDPCPAAGPRRIRPGALCVAR